MTVSAAAQSGPSASSGINPNDTYCIFDVTLQNQGTLTLSQPVLDPATNTSTSTIPMNPGPTHLHVEAGYDVNDRLVLNVVFRPSAGGSDHNFHGSRGAHAHHERPNGALRLVWKPHASDSASQYADAQDAPGVFWPGGRALCAERHGGCQSMERCIVHRRHSISFKQ